MGDPIADIHEDMAVKKIPGQPMKI